MNELLRRVTHYLFHGIMTVLLMASPIIILAGYASPEPAIQSSALHEYWDEILSIKQEKMQIAFEAGENTSGLAVYLTDIKDMIDETNLFSGK